MLFKGLITSVLAGWFWLGSVAYCAPDEEDYDPLEELRLLILRDSPEASSLWQALNDLGYKPKTRTFTGRLGQRIYPDRNSDAVVRQRLLEGKQVWVDRSETRPNVTISIKGHIEYGSLVGDGHYPIVGVKLDQVSYKSSQSGFFEAEYQTWRHKICKKILAAPPKRARRVNPYEGRQTDGYP